jgi:hypothetical protein
MRYNAQDVLDAEEAVYGGDNERGRELLEEAKFVDSRCLTGVKGVGWPDMDRRDSPRVQRVGHMLTDFHGSEDRYWIALESKA